MIRHITALTVSLFACSFAYAGGGGECFVEKTVMVPSYETVKETIQVRRFRPESRTRVVPVVRRIPQTHTVERPCTIMVPETRKRTLTCRIPKPRFENKEVTCTVMVPYQQVCKGVRRVCKMVPQKITRTVCRDLGHWEKRDCCHRCGHRVWVPNVVQKQVVVTCMKPTYEEVPYEYSVTRCRPEKRTKTIRVCKMEYEIQKREVEYTVCVPKTEMRKMQVTTYKCITEERKISCTVMVPYTEEVQVCRRVCRMVPKTIKVPACNPCRKPRCF
jgi:hypothetical protein